MKQIKLFFYAASIAVFLGSCSGKDGAPGATGPTGNANVQSETFTVVSSDWGYNSPSYYETFTVPSLTSAINTSGAVDVYVSVDNGNSWQTAPFTAYTSAGDYLMTILHTTGEVEVLWTYNVTGSPGSNPNTAYGVSVVEFKIVCVASDAIKANPNVNWSNYNEVQRTFNLKD